jgi:hypothetical protein
VAAPFWRVPRLEYIAVILQLCHRCSSVFTFTGSRRRSFTVHLARRSRLAVWCMGCDPSLFASAICGFPREALSSVVRRRFTIGLHTRIRIRSTGDATGHGDLVCDTESSLHRSTLLRYLVLVFFCLTPSSKHLQNPTNGPGSPLTCRYIESEPENANLRSTPCAKTNAASDLISDVLPFGRLWYDTPNNAIGYATHSSLSQHAVIRV